MTLKGFSIILKIIVSTFLLSIILIIPAFSQFPFKWYSLNEDLKGINVVETIDGGFMIAAQSANGIVLIRTDQMGDSIWTKSIPVNFAVVKSIISTPDFGFALAGSISSDCGIIKTDSSGNVEWTSTLPLPLITNGIFKDLVYTLNNRFVAVGDGDSLILKIPIIAEFDSSGNLLPINFNFTYLDDFWKMNNLIETDFGTVLIDGIELLNVNGAPRTLLHEYDISNGVEVNNINTYFGTWCDCRLGKNKSNDITGFGTDVSPTYKTLVISPWYGSEINFSYDYSSLTSDTSRNTYLTGTSAGDVLILKVNSIGDSAWERKYGGLALDEGKQIIYTNNNHLVVVGTTESPANGFKNVLLLITDTSGSAVSVHEFNLPKNSFYIYPNVSNNKVTISKIEENTVYLKNSIGQVVRKINSKNFLHSSMELDIHDLKTGVYYIEMGNKSRQFFKIDIE